MNEAEALADKTDDGEFILSLKDMKARIPLAKDGMIPCMTFTEINNIGNFVSAACALFAPGDVEGEFWNDWQCY